MKKIDLKKLLQKDKKSLTLMALAVVTLLLVVAGATYAYFAAQAGGGTGADLNVATGTTDSLSFSVGKDINLHVTLNDFLEGMESPHGETTATATLKANSVTNQATGRYNVFFIIDNNDFEYSTEEGQTELLLKVTDPNGNEVMDITGLKRVEDGFDITTRTGGFLITADYDIEATPTKTLESQTWKLEVTFVNLDSDQNINKGKSLNGRFYITTEKESTYELAEINAIEAESSYNSITASLTSLSGTAEIEKYYYAIEEGTSGMAYLGAGVSVARLSNKIAINDTDYIESNEMTHIFENLKPSTKYKVYSYAIDKNGIKSNVYETEVTTADYFIPIIESVTTSNTTTSIIVNVNSKRGSEDISKYYYSIDDGNFIESNEASHTFNDLSENTEHTIKVKAEDTNGTESVVYTLIAKTVTLASITSVTTSVTSTSVTVNVIAKKGDADIENYYYSIDDGETWSEGTSNSSYTFNNLTSNTTYQIRVKVVDTEERESSEAAATAKTEYVLANISGVTHSSTLNSITVSVTARAGSNAIVKYYYSKDNGSTYEESDSGSHTFSDLLDTTNYKIKIKVKDSDGRYSTEYYETIATETYINPSITKVVGTSTYNSITLNITALGGTNNVSKYYYNIDGGQDIELNGSSPTITGLTEQKEYNLNIKVEDTNGRKSNAYNLKVTTKAYLLVSVSQVEKSVTTDTIGLTVTAEAGDGAVASYEYSKDGGINWSTSANNTFSFTGLNDNQTYQIRVRVKDSNNRYSEIYEEDIKTTAYVNPSVTKVDATSTYNSITLTVTAAGGTNSVSQYFFSNDNGSTWTSGQTSNTYTFTDLTENKAYSIKVKVSDTNNKESGVVSKSVTTDAYVLPTINSLTKSSTLNSISITVNTTKGTNNIIGYYYSSDDGATWSSKETSGSHTFSGLNDTTNYNIKVKVEDSDGRTAEYGETIATVTYVNPSITKVTSTKTYNSISLTTTASKGTNNVSKYYYKVGTGSWSAAQTKNTYTISNLNENTKYTIKVKVEDSNGRASSEYSLDVTTNVYEVPTISATTSKTSSSITIDATGTKGDGNIAKYMYSKDGGSNWITNTSTSTSDSYTFENLTPYTTYQIRVKVVDNNDRESSEYSTSVRTDKGNFTNSTSNASGTYNGSAKTITVSISPTPTTIYYSETTELTSSNYSSSGSTTNPSRTNAGTTTVYWCAVKTGYNTYCSSNTITISKKSPTFTISSTTSPIDSSSTTSSITYNYTGDGTVSCTAKSPSTATYASCSVNTSSKTITFTRKAAGTQTFTISAAAGTNYSAGTSKTVTVTVAAQGIGGTCAGQNMATCIKNNYTLDSSIYYHSSSLTNGAGDNSYRYAGANPDNYVCFGSTATTCPSDNLYRIIGIFGDQVKLIKNTSIGDYYWSGSSSNLSTKWADSTLNTSTLNGTYLNGLGTTWSKGIAKTTWYVGAVTNENVLFSNAKTTYNYEVGSNKSGTTYTARIGLMYLNDYYYAATPTYWTYKGFDTATTDYRAARSSNWMTLGNDEWSISSSDQSSSGGLTFYPAAGGAVTNTKMGLRQLGTRPTFYLDSRVTLSGGKGTSSEPYTVSLSAVSQTLADTCAGQNMATCFKNNYTKDSDLYYHSSSLTNGAGDNSYRYAGANPDNYVCFGSTATTCPANNLYRIIGIFGSQVKLIKNTSIGNYYWSGSSSNESNTWSNSTLNTGTLNGTYLSGLGTTWSNKIASTTWYVGGMASANGYLSNAKTAYDYELGSNKTNTTTSAKIGLMYVSEYYYAASPTYWTYPGYDSDATKDYRAAKTSNWMALGSTEWTISRTSDISRVAFYVFSHGYVTTGYVNNLISGARPTFLLTSSVTLTSGSGTSADPFRIN